MPSPLSPPAAGDLVALTVPGDTAYVDLVRRLLVRGAFPICLDPSLTPAEREPILADLQPSLTVVDAHEIRTLRDLLPAPQEGDLPRGRPLHLTSGTTGRPKPVFSGPLDRGDAAALVAEERELWGFTGTDVHLVLSPLHHSAPLRFALHTLLAGGRLVVPGRFDAARVTAAISAERPTTLFCVPTHLQRLFAHWEEHGVPDLSCFRLVAHAGAPCPEPVKRRLMELFPPGTTWEFYGSTEGQFTACRSEDWVRRPGTVGRARAGRRLSVDPDGTIWCAVPSFARFEYLGHHEATHEAWRHTEDGPAFTVHDHGRLDPEGYLFLDGRRSDLIITGGVNVYPLEVEQALAEHPGVAEVAVYGVPDAHWGQRVCAAVVGEADPRDLDAFARERLAPAKRPKEWQRVDDLPRTASGKVQRSRLAASG